MTFGIETKGVYAIATTPFFEDGSIDFASIDRLTDFYEESGCTGITILGIMGEAPKMEPDESRAIIKRVVSRAKVPIIVGVSAPGFAGMRSLAREVRWTWVRLGRDDCADPGTAHRRPDRQLFRRRRRSGRRRRTVGAAGLSADADRRHVAGRDRQDHYQSPVLPDAEARGLAGAGKGVEAARHAEGRRTASRSRSSAAMAACSSISNRNAAPTAQ
jgi:hypothetical protein